MDGPYRVDLVFEDGSVKSIEVDAGEHVWDAAYRQDILLPNSCLQGWCLTCAARVIEGEWDQDGFGPVLRSGSRGWVHAPVHREAARTDAHPRRSEGGDAEAPDRAPPADAAGMTVAQLSECETG